MRLRKNVAVSESGFVFDPHTGESFSVNETGKDILELLKQGKTDDEIMARFQAEYDVDKYVFEKNYFDFLNTLAAMNLLILEQ